jgi:hypothetical protein
MSDAFPVGTLVTLPARTSKESHAVVHRRDEVYKVVGANIYTREIALADFDGGRQALTARQARQGNAANSANAAVASAAFGSSKKTKHGPLLKNLGPVGTNNLRKITEAQARMLWQNRDVSVKRTVKRDSAGISVLRDRAELTNTSVYSDPIPVEYYVETRADAAFAKKYADYTIQAGPEAPEAPSAGVIGMRVRDAMGKEYTVDDVVWKYGSKDLQEDLDLERIVLVGPGVRRGTRRTGSQSAQREAQIEPDIVTMTDKKRAIIKSYLARAKKTQKDFFRQDRGDRQDRTAQKASEDREDRKNSEGRTAKKAGKGQAIG